MAHSGFIIVPREDFDRIWQQLIPAHKVVLLQCILSANYRDREWWDGKETVTVKRGQFATSYRGLAVCCGRAVSVLNVRTALANLRKMGEIRTENRKRYTLVTVVNYERYADLGLYVKDGHTSPNTPSDTLSDTPLDTRPAQGQHATNTPSTTRESSKSGRHKGSKTSESTNVDSVEFMETWNSTSLPKIRSMSPDRKARLNRRARQADFRNHWKEALSALSGNAWYLGENDRGWKATVDWFLRNDTNWLKAWERQTTSRVQTENAEERSRKQEEALIKEGDEELAQYDMSKAPEWLKEKVKALAEEKSMNRGTEDEQSYDGQGGTEERAKCGD